MAGRKKVKQKKIRKGFTLSKKSVDILKRRENASGWIDWLIRRYPDADPEWEDDVAQLDAAWGD